ncbi:putative ferredoxin [Tanacetum coccineum]|uniref:Ferredoxin n=1 Tax=Tanacetum coccineum TaxID=301880 RepID=A0ABQ4YBW4_9ASTR
MYSDAKSDIGFSLDRVQMFYLPVCNKLCEPILAPLTIRSKRSFFPLVQNDYLEPSSRRLFSTTATETSPRENEETQKISVTFFDNDGEREIKVPVGMSMLEAAHENDIELEGACEGSLACSTCHVIVMDVEQYNKLEDPTDEENDMLDLAFGLTETSRLGCQVIAKPELDGLRLALPAATRNFAVDGYKPKPH